MTHKYEIYELYNHYIDGKSFKSSNAETIDIIDPSSGKLLTRSVNGNLMDLDYAINSSHNGFHIWSDLTGLERSRIMLNISNLLLEELDRFTYLEAINTGKPISKAKQEIITCARYFEYFAGVADKVLGKVIPTPTNHHMYSTREPFGISAQIIPWNAPLSQVGRGAAPALCAGNSVILKPAEETPITTVEFSKLCIKAGLPAGVINTILGRGDNIGSALTSHKKINHITFTGSVDTGRKVLAKSAENIIPATVELGGKSPFIVFPDANLPEAAKVACRAFVFNTGQICSAGTRLLIHKDIYDEFISYLISELKKVEIGKALDDKDIGPVISKKQKDTIEKYIDIGIKQGANIIYKGDLPKDLPVSGYFVPPILFGAVDNKSTIAQEEIFGPVAVTIPFDTEAEAMKIANDSKYGLAAAIWTNNNSLCFKLARKLAAGQVYINDYMPVGVEAPFGGYKNSGFGREKGLAAIEGYSQIKTVMIKV